jgi:hypothetical protein
MVGGIDPQDPDGDDHGDREHHEGHAGQVPVLRHPPPIVSMDAEGVVTLG